MGYHINSDYKEELVLRIRNTYMSSLEEKKNNYVLKNLSLKSLRGGVYFGNYNRASNYINYQNSIVKVSYLANDYAKQWSAHGRYLQREGAQIEGKVGLGFDKENERVDIAEVVGDWQDQGDKRIFKVIISPEQAHRMNLRTHVRLVMEKLELDYGARLQWVAIDHYNTDNPHVHIIIRGHDREGNEIRINKEYIKHGFRLRSKEAATRQIGVRLLPEIMQRREMAIHRLYITALDREIMNLKDENGIVTFKNKLPKNSIDLERRLHIIGRLKYLETLGFVEKEGIITWKVGDGLLKELKKIQISNDIIKRKANHINNISEKHLPIVRTFLKKGESIAGRVVGFGLHDENYDKRYFILEGLDGKIYYVHPTKNMILQRNSAKINNNDIIHMQVKSYYKKGKEKTYLKFTNWGKLERLKWSKDITEADKYFIKNFLRKSKALDINKDIRAFRRKYFNMMQERMVRLKTIGHLDKSFKVKRIMKKRE